MRGKELVAKILSRLPKKKREGVLEYIDRKDHPLAEAIKERMVTLETLLLLREQEMQLLQSRLDTKDIARVLKSATEPLQNQLLKGISQKKKALILEERALLGGVKKSEIEKAEQRILAELKALIESGEILPGEEWIE